MGCFGNAYNQHKFGKPQIRCFGALLITVFMAFEERYKVHKAKYVEQKAFDGRVSEPWLSRSC